jgi:hypothetical protein
MSRNGPYYWASLLMAIFVCGFLATVAVTAESSLARLGSFGTLCLVLALTQIIVQRMRKAPSRSQLTTEIRSRSRKLIETGTVLLVPCDRDRPSTQKVLIGASPQENELYIDRYGWSDTIRRYVVRQDGTIGRQLLCRTADTRIGLSDRLWCFAPLTCNRLHYLLDALSGLYVARRQLQPVR